ncbi:hypothetical protein DRO66_00530 [Candidatus Bathyarchaeota archaeon]|nr:MAG: hypothetical protein DRO66_00530 [Candidatus Bathyarchaeota archaeon]
MIQDRFIRYRGRITYRAFLKREGFISQHYIARNYASVSLKNVRKVLSITSGFDAIRLDTDGAITYWYRKTLDFKDPRFKQGFKDIKRVRKHIRPKIVIKHESYQVEAWLESPILKSRSRSVCIAVAKTEAAVKTKAAKLLRRLADSTKLYV